MPQAVDTHFGRSAKPLEIVHRELTTINVCFMIITAHSLEDGLEREDR